MCIIFCIFMSLTLIKCTKQVYFIISIHRAENASNTKNLTLLNVPSGLLFSRWLFLHLLLVVANIFLAFSESAFQLHLMRAIPEDPEPGQNPLPTYWYTPSGASKFQFGPAGHSEKSLPYFFAIISLICDICKMFLKFHISKALSFITPHPLLHRPPLRSHPDSLPHGR